MKVAFIFILGSLLSISTVWSASFYGVAFKGSGDYSPVAYAHVTVTDGGSESTTVMCSAQGNYVVPGPEGSKTYCLEAWHYFNDSRGSDSGQEYQCVGQSLEVVFHLQPEVREQATMFDATKYLQYHT